jgi:hypothetical protein
MIRNQIIEGIKMSLPIAFDIKTVTTWIFQRLGTGAAILVVGLMYLDEEKKNAEQIDFLQSELTSTKVMLVEVKESLDLVNASLYKMEYMPSYEIIKLGLAGLSHEEAIAKIKFWVAEEWVAKIANLTTLCEEPGRALLIKLAGNAARAGDYCRAMH